MAKHFEEGGTVFVAEDADGAWIAKLQANIFEPPPSSKIRQMGYIGEVYVEPPFRRQGIAKRLVETAYDWFRSKGLDTAAIYVMEENPGGIEAWKRMGYRHVAHYMTRKI
jgi:GNAT superfamily N-acetyltransferase